MYTDKKVAESIKKIEEGLTYFLDSNKWKQYLAFQTKFHRYSYGNTILILSQKPDATNIAGFNTWKKLGRYVKKGEKGIAILAPVTRKIRKKDEDKGKPDYYIVGFRVVYVYDISQTDGASLPEMLVEKLSGDIGLYENLLQASPYTVREVPCLRGANGTFNMSTKEIRILRGLEELQKAKTLVHEWAHGILHGEQPGDTTRAQKELEAESVAFIVCSALNLDTSDYSFGYLASWGGDDTVKMLKKSADRIQKASDAILSQIEKRSTQVSA